MNIVLIGMMGSGKTSVGKKLSKLLSYEFVDTDEHIERGQEMSITDIVNSKGEEYFRNIESDIISEISKNSNTIISTGGGCILKSENIMNLKENGDIWYLKCSLNEISKRIQRNDTRYLLYNTSIGKIYDDRENLYQEYSDYTVDCSKKSIDDICGEIINNE